VSIYSTGPGEGVPLVVKPKIAWKMLACSNTRGYELLSAGELESFLDGRSRKIIVASIHGFIARRLAAQREAPAPQTRRGRGRPRKTSGTVGVMSGADDLLAEQGGPDSSNRDDAQRAGSASRAAIIGAGQASKAR
jgi:hypothetical protein